jgi:hypothetical protein
MNGMHDVLKYDFWVAPRVLEFGLDDLSDRRSGYICMLGLEI